MAPQQLDRAVFIARGQKETISNGWWKNVDKYIVSIKFHYWIEKKTYPIHQNSLALCWISTHQFGIGFISKSLHLYLSNKDMGWQLGFIRRIDLVEAYAKKSTQLVAMMMFVVRSVTQHKSKYYQNIIFICNKNRQQNSLESSRILFPILDK